MFACVAAQAHGLDQRAHALPLHHHNSLFSKRNCHPRTPSPTPIPLVYTKLIAIAMCLPHVAPIPLSPKNPPITSLRTSSHRRKHPITTSRHSSPPPRQVRRHCGQAGAAGRCVEPLGLWPPQREALVAHSAIESACHGSGWGWGELQVAVRQGVAGGEGEDDNGRW